ncbi:hypothetical protein [Streptomyces niveus]
MTHGVRVGDTVHDPARDRVGVVMAHEGPYVQLRPLGGGREWDADPARVRLLGAAELLSARVSDVNTRSRTGLGCLPEATPGGHTMWSLAPEGAEE